MTDLTEFQQTMGNLLPQISIRWNEPLSKHTSFRIGGPAEVMAFPRNREELAMLLKTSKLLDRKPAILGAGTNVLAPDRGIPGLVICLKDCLDGMEQRDDSILRFYAGVTMSRAAVFASRLALSGMEFSHGIPGTVGGGVYMNAGAYGGQIADICTCVEVMDYDGNIHVYSRDEMRFSYRHSLLEECPGIVICADFQLTAGDPEEIKERMRVLQEKRSASQPLHLPSAGSAFKRPQGAYAAALLEQAGLKGFRLGNAAVSQKHAGFVVNLGGATAEDVKELLRQAAQKVRESSGISLEPEIRIW